MIIDFPLIFYFQASFGSLRAVMEPVLKHMDLHAHWKPPPIFAIHVFKAIIYSIQSQNSYFVIQVGCSAAVRHLQCVFVCFVRVRQKCRQQACPSGRCERESGLEEFWGTLKNRWDCGRWIRAELVFKHEHFCEKCRAGFAFGDNFWIAIAVTSLPLEMCSDYPETGLLRY